MTNSTRQPSQQTVQNDAGTEFTKRFLKQMFNTWVDGVLDASLYNLTAETLSPQQKEISVPNIWRRKGRIKGEDTSVKLRQSTQLLQYFRSYGTEGIIISGKTGTGKRILLIELLAQLISDQLPREKPLIPVYLSFQDFRPDWPIDEWVAEEISAFYGIDIAHPLAWLQQNRIILLAYGLEFVPIQQRERVANELKTEWFDNPDRTAVITCHDGVFKTVEDLYPNSAIIDTDPLSAQQAGLFLSRYGQDLRGLRIAIDQDERVMEVARLPFFLNVMSLAFTNLPHFDQIITPDNSPPDLLHNRIFTFFVKRLTRSQKPHLTFGYRNITFTIGWLANKMLRRSRSSFSINDLQPDWLETARETWRYSLISRTWLSILQGVMFALIFAGASVTLGLFGHAGQLPNWFAWVPLTALLVIPTLAVAGGFLGAIWDRFRLLRHGPVSVGPVSVRHLFVSGSIAFGPVFIQVLRKSISGTTLNPAELVTVGLIAFATSFILLPASERLWFTQIDHTNEIRLNGRYRFNLMAGLRQSWLGAVIGLVVGLILGLIAQSGFSISGLFPNWSSLLTGTPTAETVFVSSAIPIAGAAVGGAITGWLTGWLANAYVDIGSKSNLTSSQPITENLERGVTLLGLILILGTLMVISTTGVVGFLLKGLPGLLFALEASILLGTGLALFIGLRSGLSDILKHFALRSTLWFTHSLPFQLTEVLDDAVEVLQMYEVGDRYIFLHPLLQSYYVRRYRYKHGLEPIDTNFEYLSSSTVQIQLSQSSFIRKYPKVNP